ncbi:MAG: pyroglutamyl-peptidase I [Bacillota bacterium]
MKYVLVTGFEPFGGDSINPSSLAAQQLDGFTVEGYQVVTGELPTVARVCGERAISLIEKWQPEVVINVGQAGGRPDISVERVAINLRDYRIPDNAGQKPQDEPIRPGGPVAYFATIPARSIVRRLNDAGIPASVSYSAGTFCCNEVFYAVSDYIAARGLAARNGFVHIPLLPVQAATSSPPRPSMALATVVEALKVVVEECVAAMQEKKVTGRTTGG